MLPLGWKCWNPSPLSLCSGAPEADAEEGEAAGAPGLGADSTLEALQERWGSDPRWQVPRVDVSISRKPGLCMPWLGVLSCL